MMTWFWTLELIDSPLLTIVSVATAVLAFVVGWAARRPARRARGGRPLAMAVALAAGAGAVGVTILILQAMNLFEGTLPEGSVWWVLAAGGAWGMGVLALASRPWWNRILAVILILTGALMMGLGVNRLYGITHTPAAVFGVSALPQVTLPNAADASGASLTAWHAPADMPSHGRVGALTGDLTITPSKPYAPRPATVYLPPAALVANPPRLPVIVAMMGQPGSPDPTVIARQLDAYAAAHHGLAPITVVVDQLAGNGKFDPICMDSSTYGAVSTYVNTDVVAYIKTHFAVSKDPADWAIAGYSNGGSCAWQWGTQFPHTWGAILDVSGNEFPGSQHQADVVTRLWKGDKAAYRAWLPEAQLAAHRGEYTSHLAIFTHGGADAEFGPGQLRNAQLAQAAGFEVQAFVVPGASHVGAAVSSGYAFAIAQFSMARGLGAIG